ncbi:MAG: MarR family transcriptional regulator [Clostridia bacterium]|nr:MarR family transcriptional regulator [Clostridia bacterium]
MKDNSVLDEVKILHNLVRQRLCSDPQAVSDGKLMSGRGYFLRYLAENDGKDIFQRDIEKAFKIRRSTVTATLNRMEENGLIIRSSVEFDSRLKRIKLTPKGRQMHLSFQNRADSLDKEVSSALTEKERAEFIKIIKKIQSKVENKS